MFNNRQEAGQRLAKKLENLLGEDAVILALPRGGVVLGAEVARALELPLDILAVRKIGHPSSPEFAIGAIEEHGDVLLSESAKEIDRQWLREKKAREEEEARRRGRVYRVGGPALALKKKTVILVDDGIATGLTMRLAVRAVATQKPKKIIVAVPVAPADAVEELRAEGAEVIVLEPPEEFLGAVGSHYIQFNQVEDDEVVRLMKNI